MQNHILLTTSSAVRILNLLIRTYQRMKSFYLKVIRGKLITMLREYFKNS